MINTSINTVSINHHKSSSQNSTQVKTPQVATNEKPIKKSKASDIIADTAYKKAIDQISEFLKPLEVSVDLTYDSKSGIRNLILSDKNTGQKIMEMPPEGVIEMAEKAKIENIGALLDKKG